MINSGERVRTALRSGVVTGLAYAVVEAWWLDGAEWLLRHSAPFAAADPALRIGAFVVHPLVLGIIAALIALVFPSKRVAVIAGPLALLVVVASHRVLWPYDVRSLALRAAAIATFGALLLAAASMSRAQAQVSRHAAWGSAALLASTLWIVFGTHLPSRGMRFALLGSVALMIAAAAWCYDRLPRRVARPLAAAFAVTLAIFAATRSDDPPPSTVFTSHDAAPAAPDILLVTLDTVRADHLTLYGYHRRTSPYLEELARSGSLYLHAYASGDQTLTSHASMFTGVHVTRHGAGPTRERDYRKMLAPFRGSAPTIAQLLQRNGYATAAVVGNSGYLRRAAGLDRGFQHYDARPGGTLGEVHGFAMRYRVAAAGAALVPSLRRPPTRRADTITNEALAVARVARSTGRPLFLFVNYMDAHAPYDPPPEWVGRFHSAAGDRRATPIADRAFDRMRRGESPLTAADRAALVDRYDAAIAFIDSEVRRLVTSLDAGRDLVVIVTSDHGESFGEHGLYDHGNGVTPANINVPMLVRFPRQNAERRMEPVSSVDVAPTIARAAGIRFGGSDGLALIPGSTLPSRFLYSESLPTGSWIGISDRFDRKEVAVIAGMHKYVLRSSGGGWLFDRSSDPAEMAPIRDPLAERVLAATARPFLRGAPVASSLPADALDQLRSLGYLR